MKYVIIILFTFLFSKLSFAQKLPPPSPCLSNEIYRQFDFWIGEWDVYNVNGAKAGESKISLMLDSCVILEEWTSMPTPVRATYKGKSFNTYNGTTHQWQQTWVDNVGSSTHYVYGKYENQKMVFQTDPWHFSKDTMAIDRLTFFNLAPDKVRQLGEISKDNGQTWATQYDLEYRRMKSGE